MAKQVFKNSPEIVEPIELAVTGKLPAWLDGVLYKTGQGIFNIALPNGETKHITHPFDGLSQVHRFEFQGLGNTVRYNSRHIARGYEKRIIRRDDALVKFGRDPCQTTFGRMQSFYYRLRENLDPQKMWEEDPSSENINVTITPNFPLPKELTDDKLVLVVKTDANVLQLIDATTLEPKKLFTYAKNDPTLNGQISASHHQTDPTTGEYFNFVLNLGRDVSIAAFSLDASGKSHPFESIRHAAGQPAKPVLPSYMHAFSMTDRYVVLPCYPYYYTWNGLALLWTGSLMESFSWDAVRPTQFHVLDRETRKHVATYEADPYFAFHTVNAWDEGGDVVFDVCAYDDAGIVQWTEGVGKESNNVKYKEPKVRRYRLVDVEGVAKKQQDGAVQVHVKYEVRGVGLELPRMNPKYEKRPYRFVYGIAHYKLGTSTLKKMDLDGGELNAMWREDGLSPSEPVFIPDPSGEEEDEGVVLSVVNDILTEKRCFLLVLNARTFEEIARAEVGDFGLLTLHGSFVDALGRNVAVC